MPSWTVLHNCPPCPHIAAAPRHRDRRRRWQPGDRRVVNRCCSSSRRLPFGHPHGDGSSHPPGECHNLSAIANGNLTGRIKSSTRKGHSAHALPIDDPLGSARVDENDIRQTGGSDAGRCAMKRSAGPTRLDSTSTQPASLPGPRTPRRERRRRRPHRSTEQGGQPDDSRCRPTTARAGVGALAAGAATPAGVARVLFARRGRRSEGSKRRIRHRDREQEPAGCGPQRFCSSFRCRERTLAGKVAND